MDESWIFAWRRDHFRGLPLPLLEVDMVCFTPLKEITLDEKWVYGGRIGHYFLFLFFSREKQINDWGPCGKWALRMIPDYINK